MMNLDDLKAVWRSQDAAPLHGLNETLIRQALRQSEEKRQKWRRIERWVIYALGAGVVAGLALCLANMILLMIDRDDMNGLIGWDLVLPVVGAAGALISARAVSVNHRAQALREQRFGESLKDQLNRSIAQLDYQATTLHRTLVLVLVLLAGVCPIALLLAISRLNEKPFSDDGYMVVWLILMSVFGVAIGVWSIRQQTWDVVLPHKRRLEALLKELTGER